MTQRVLIAGFRHETNTFSKLATDLAAYRARDLYYGHDILSQFAGTRTEVAAFANAAKRYGWELAPIVYADATPSGKVTREVFDHVTGMLLKALTQDGPYDAILLALHGAMVAEHLDDGEGTLLSLVREAVGPVIPIGVTLDLHANVTDRMAALADVMVSYRTYPHVDAYEVGAEAAELIARTIDGEIRPRTLVARGAMLDGADHGRTSAPGPMTEALAMAKEYESEHSILAVCINAGFPWADIRETGPSVVVVGDGNDSRQAEIASILIQHIYDNRERTTIETVSVADAVARMRKGGKKGGPIVVADFADNPGGGGYGDATGLLKGMLDAKLKNAAFANMYDPDAAAACTQAGEGAEVTLTLGGRLDPTTGPPIQVTGTVIRLSDGNFALEGPMSKGVKVKLGSTAVLRVNGSHSPRLRRDGGIDIIITSRRYQVYDQNFFKHAGIDIAKKKAITVKSAHHFRAAFAPIASEIILVDEGGGITSRNFKKLPYKKVRRPVWPLD
jgi:microcystin degradation protein MlrC